MWRARSKAIHMKLYDGGRAPNPRRTRIFLAEKEIELPIEQVDLGAMQHKSAAYAAVNPLMRVPALVLGPQIALLREESRELGAGPDQEVGLGVDVVVVDPDHPEPDGRGHGGVHGASHGVRLSLPDNVRHAAPRNVWKAKSDPVTAAATAGARGSARRPRGSPDDLLRAGQHRRGHCKAESLRCLEVDDQLLAGSSAFEDPGGVHPRLVIGAGEAR